jgi:hypothetical protein
MRSSRCKIGTVLRNVFRAAGLHILKLRFVHAKIVPEFVENSLAHFVANFSLIRANRLDISLVQNDTVRSTAKIRHALVCGRHTLKDPRTRRRVLPRLGFSAAPCNPLGLLPVGELHPRPYSRSPPYGRSGTNTGSHRSQLDRDSVPAAGRVAGGGSGDLIRLVVAKVRACPPRLGPSCPNGSTVHVRGLLFLDAGTYKLVASRNHGAVAIAKIRRAYYTASSMIARTSRSTSSGVL